MVDLSLKYILFHVLCNLLQNPENIHFLGGAPQSIKIMDSTLRFSKNGKFPRKFNSLDHGNLKKDK